MNRAPSLMTIIIVLILGVLMIFGAFVMQLWELHKKLSDMVMARKETIEQAEPVPPPPTPPIFLKAQTARNLTSRDKSETLSWREYTVTGYTLREEECGKPPGHPEYGITTSGARTVVGITAAAGPELPFGTKILIPELAWMNGTGIFVVQDRGGAVGKDCIDIFFGDPEIDPDCVRRALDFGKLKMQGAVLE